MVLLKNETLTNRHCTNTWQWHANNQTRKTIIFE